MDNHQIMQRLRQLSIEEQKIKAKQDYKEISLNQTDWFSSSANVIIQGNIIENSVDLASYISYKESNNSFELPPKFPLLQFMHNYKEIEIEFFGEIVGECEVDLYVITYQQKTKNMIHSVSLNTSKIINIENNDCIRLAIRLVGKGNFKLSKLVLKPKFSFMVSNFQRHSKKNDNVDPKTLTVAMVVDEFTYESLNPECNAVYLSPETWRETLELHKPDIFFCESAWAGIDPDIREWRGKIYSSINFKNENRKELLEILQYCNEYGIKTVFWNKEDPSHYEDKVHNFVDTAVKFDYIFTTSEECVELYKKEYRHNNVFPLMFGVQPKHFNPIETYERTNEVIFAGSYYRQHPNRCVEMNNIFNLILDKNIDLLIYDRQYYNNDDNHKFPEEYTEYIQPRLPYTKLDKAYKGSKYAININTETHSNTMFARRVFELMASNTLVISNYSKGLEKQFGDLLFLLKGSESDQQKLQLLHSIDYNQLRLKALRFVLNYHTYEERFSYILDSIGYKVIKKPLKVTVILLVTNEQELNEALALFSSQTYQYKKLLIINTTNNSLVTSFWATKYGSESINVTDLNMLSKYNKSLTTYIESDTFTIMNLKYYYGQQFLSDMMHSYKYLDSNTVIVKDPSQPSYRFVSSSSLFAAVVPTKAIEFLDPAADTNDDFITRIHNIGFRIFNIDEFNILYPENNTFQNQLMITV
ncbi:glycosyltransferase [Paenibacillus sp. FSL R5-0407]|uniref:CgeB family protein n=1 Tax=Paenibacillus sp. FSL R5-0407 TaxID=2975320 RepID=UPI0030F89A7F